MDIFKDLLFLLLILGSLVLISSKRTRRRNVTVQNEDLMDTVACRYLLTQLRQRGVDPQLLSRLETMEYGAVRRHVIREHLLTYDEVNEYAERVQKHTDAIRRVLDNT